LKLCPYPLKPKSKTFLYSGIDMRKENMRKLFFEMLASSLKVYKYRITSKIEHLNIELKSA
jgi:hypothetical protein